MSRSVSDNRQSGSALVLVLVVIAMLSLSAYTFSEMMITEYRATDAFSRQARNNAAACSGPEYVAALLTYGGIGWESDLYNNPDLFHVTLGEGYGFTIISPLEDQETAAGSSQGTMRMGLVDECARLNVNALAEFDPEDNIARNMLLTLPNMTEEIADCILDWIDADSTPREYGSESESYTSVLPRNGPIGTLDELLFVAGVTPELLYGEDANRNGLLDLNEDDADESLPWDDGDGVLNPGWIGLLSVSGSESNLRHDIDYFGQPRINLNSSSLVDLYDQLEEELGEDAASFIVAYRMGSGGGSGSSSSSGTQSGSSGSGSQNSTQGSSGSSSGSSTGSGSSSSGSTSGSSGSSSSGSSSTTSGTTGTSSTTGSNGSVTTQNPLLGPGGGSSGGTASTGNSATDSALQGAASGLASAVTGSSDGASTRGGMDLSGGGSVTINSLYELLDAEVEAQVNGSPTTLTSPWSSDAATLQEQFPILLDLVALSDSPTISGRVNVNQASLAVLSGIPDMPSGLPEAIVAARQQHVAASNFAGQFSSSSWLLSEGLVELETMKLLDRFLTGQGAVFRLQVVGHGDGPDPVARIEAVVDASGTVPTIIWQRDLRELGPGFRRQDLPEFGVP